MSSRQTVCENCVSICQVPKSLSKDVVISFFIKYLRGRVTDLVTVAGTEQDRNLTRWVVWLESAEDVRYILESLREDRIQVAENVFTVTFRRTDPCDIPEEWLQRESQHFYNETEVTHKPPISPRRFLQKSDYIKRQHGNQQNVQNPENPPHIPGYYQSVSPNVQIEVEKTNVGMSYEQQQASHNLQLNQYYLEQENTPQHGRIHPHMIPNIPHGNPPISYPYMPYVDAPPVGERSGQNLPLYNIPIDPNVQFEQHPRFYPNMMHFGMPPYFNPRASGMSGGYNVPSAGKTTPQFTDPYSGYPTAGYHSSSKQPSQPGLTVDDHPEHSANVDDEDDSGDKYDLHHEREQCTQEVEERPTKILVSNLPSSAHEEYLEMFFESPKNVGVQAKNVELDEETNSAVVEFGDPDDVDVVLGKRPVKMMGQVVDIEVYTPEPLCTIQVKGPQTIMQLETLELYFDNEKKSSGGNVKHIEYDSEDDAFYVSFGSAEIAQRVLEKPNHTVSKKNLHVQLCKPKSNKKKLQNKADKYKEVAEDTAKVREPVCSVKVKGVKALPSRETLEFYFENQKRSGGVDIEDIQTDEEDDDIVYIKYKSEQVARTVADKNHVLEKCELDVSLYVPPKPLPSYENKVLIKGLNPKTTQDCLFNFIEAKSGFTTESMIRHTQQEDVVMVTMEANRDFTFEKLEKRFANARLEGNTLKFARVPVTDCIIVYNLSDDMTAETIQYYFENKRRSGGGPVRKVVMNDDNTCFVYFTDFKTIDSVLEKQHTLGKEVLLVQKYQECIARPEGELIQRKLNIPAPLILKSVDPEKIKFIDKSHVHKELISFELKKVHAHIIWPKESGHIQLDCTLTKEDKNCFKLVKTWKTEVLRIFEDLMNNIVVHKIDVLQDIWQNVLEKINTVSVSKPEDAAVIVEKKLGMITVAGKKDIVDEIARKINEIKIDAMAELEKERQTITENVTGLKPLETKLLLICRFPNEMKKVFDGLKVNINTKANKIIFEGSLTNVQNAKLKMYERKNRFQFQMYKDMSQMKQTLFLSDKTKDFIVEKLKSRHVTAAWEVKQSGELVVCFDGDISEDVVTSLISDSVKESDIALRDESKPLMNSKQWSSELEELNSCFQGKCIVEVSEDISKVIICATEDILDEVVDCLKKFLHLNTVLVHKVSHSRNVHRLIEKHHQDVLNKISKDLNDPSVRITPLENYEGFEVHGTEYGIKKATIQLNKLFDQIRSRECTIDKPGLSSHMDTPKGKDSLNTIESMLHCTITVKKGEEQANTDVGSECEYYGRRNRSRSSVRDDRALPPTPPVPKPRSTKQQQADDVQLDNVRVSVSKGEIARQRVDVIVNTTATNLDLTQGATSASLLKAGGPELQQEVRANYPNGIQYGEIAITSGKKLKCQVVIHSSLTAWDGNNAESCKDALEKLTQNCLEEAEKQNFTSIAFPAIGTGKLGYPRDIVASSLFNVVGKFKAKSLQDVRFVVYQKDYSTVQAFENEMARWQKSLARQSRKFNLYEDMHKDRRSSYVYANEEDDEENTYEMIYPADVKDQDYKIGNISVVVKQGDITEENADCIVNSSNEALDLTRGAVSKAILKKGGRSLAGELDKLRKKMKQNHFVVSSAKGLPCKNIMHVVARDTCKEWEQIIITCLDEAERRSLNSIAFPALGTGIQMKASDMALTMVSAVTEFEKSKPTSLTDIRFVIYQKEMVEDFHKAVRGTKDKGAGWSLGGFVQAVKGIMPWSSSHGEETYARPKTDNNKVTFIINAMSEDIIDKAVEKLESVLEREVEKKVFDDSIIRKMDDNQLMEIKAIARQHHLNLTLEKKQGCMEISGIASNILTASDKIYRIIRDAVTLEQQQNSADILSNIVQWYFIEIREAGQKLQPYVKDLNFKIENAYKNKDKEVKFSAEHVTYILNFQKMEEYPEDDPADVVSVIRRDLIKQSSFGAFEPPATWADMTGNLRVVTVQPGTPEYQTILQTFTATSGGSFTVNKIERVQNKTLWQQYQAKKKQLENQNAQGTQNERLLWHGTSPDSIDNINAHGFNRSYCGKNAVAYGNGVYFAVNASYSCGGYSQPDSSGVKRVYYCRVLTGEYTTGTYGMRVPPQKVGATSSTDLYDSVVDIPAGPSMFIIFHDTQAYPEYLLSFQ